MSEQRSDERTTSLFAPDHLYTWVDVDRHFAALAAAGLWPAWLVEVSAYWDSVRLTVTPNVSVDEVWKFLADALGALTTDRTDQRILLETVTQESADRALDVELDRTAEQIRVESRPTWTPRRILARSAISAPSEKIVPHDIPVCVFHSFKGGVGRTLHCVATGLEIAKRGQRVLLVDADLDAPGISWMWEAQALRTDFSFEDFLALLHGAEDEDRSDALDLGTRRLANQELDGIVVMPARRHQNRAEPPRIEPIHLLANGRDPRLLTDALAELSSRIKADVVLIDLRAGINELNAPLLLDPRTNRVLVTTVSDPSVKGTQVVLQELARRATADPDGIHPDVTVLLTQFNPRSHQDRLVEVANEVRAAAMCASGTAIAAEASENETDELLVDQDSRGYMLTSPFNAEFLNLPSSWAAVTDLIRRTGLTGAISPLVDALAQDTRTYTQDESGVDADEIVDMNRIREYVATYASQQTYAEQTGDESDFLVTDALGNLAETHQTDVPIEVVIGAKGSGKTFTFLQVCSRQHWSDFVSYVDSTKSVQDMPGSDSDQVMTVPVIQSRNLEDVVADHLNDRRRTVAELLGNGEPANSLEMRDLISGQLEKNSDDITWRRTWLTCFARSVGLAATTDDSQEILTEFARNNRALFVVDGLEDLFDKFTENHQQQRALRILLTDCAEWLRSLRGRPLGLLTFVRRDLAQLAIVQNFAQFEARHANYALQWNREEALRLAAWVCKRGGALDEHSEEDIRTKAFKTLSQWMRAIWGDKMGGPNSREARSDQWFFAALSDFDSQIQARDIVTFIGNAADKSINDNRYTRRLLTPSAMRKALPECSKKKIEAISQENPPVGDLLTRLRNAPEAKRQVPFTLDAVRISPEQAKLLETNGVLFRENDQYWIPEIFRHGLGFTAKGRPRILAIANLVRRRNDLGR